MGLKVVAYDSLAEIHRNYKKFLRSPKWKITRAQEWDDGMYTYVFEYVGQD
jgi:hypothetical protein